MCVRRLGVALAALAGLEAHAQPLVEPFDNVATLVPSGWHIQNNSEPSGLMGYFQGTVATFPAQASAGYMAADYRSVGELGTISNWLVLPTRTMNNGDALSFWTRTITPPAYADRLQVRLSTSGASTNVGVTSTETGDFSALLLDINPTYLVHGTGSYPTEWTQFVVVLSGLPGPISGRLAFRYFVQNAGASGGRSDYIGIDTVEFTPGGVVQGRCCISATGECTIATPVTCANLGGIYGGDGTDCLGPPCPQPPVGACCRAPGGCEVVTQAVCLGAGGTYHGDGSACAGVVCPPTYTYVGKPVFIPDGSGSSNCGFEVVAEVFVPESFPVAQVEAAFVIAHNWQGDLRVRLSREGGPTVRMVDRAGWPQHPYGFSADDFGNPAALSYFRISGTAPATYDLPAVAFPGLFRPSGLWRSEEDPAALAGASSLGRWYLAVSDCAGGQDGRIMKFALILHPPPGVTPCYANCDESTVAPVLTPNDFQCFLNLFATSDQRANCDASLGFPQLTANDFSCFLNRYAAGCP